MAKDVPLPYYEFQVSGGGLLYPLAFPVPVGIDGVEISNTDRENLISAIVNVLEGLTGVTGVTVKRHDDVETDVTP